MGVIVLGGALKSRKWYCFSVFPEISELLLCCVDSTLERDREQGEIEKHLFFFFVSLFLFFVA